MIAMTSEHLKLNKKCSIRVTQDNRLFIVVIYADNEGEENKLTVEKFFFCIFLCSQYLTNNANANGSTLVKVIAAVLKFSPQQTQVALEKEAQRKSLVSNK